MTYEQKSMYEQAIADGERMLDRKANVLLGRLYAASGKKEEAKKILFTTSTLTPKIVDAPQ